MPALFVRDSGGGWTRVDLLAGGAGIPRYLVDLITGFAAPRSIKYWTGTGWSTNLILEYPTATAPTISVTPTGFFDKIADWSIGTWSTNSAWTVDWILQANTPGIPSWNTVLSGNTAGASAFGNYDFGLYDTTPGLWSFRGAYRFTNGLDPGPFSAWSTTVDVTFP